jgi:hypothetical protein
MQSNSCKIVQIDDGEASTVDCIKLELSLTHDVNLEARTGKLEARTGV